MPWNEKKPLKKRIGWPLIATFLIAGPSIARATQAQEPKITVVNPLGQPPPIARVPMAPRLSSLDGKTIYIVQNFILPNAKKGDEPFASWLKLPKDAKIPQFASPSRINIIAVGGETNLFWEAGDFGYISSASVDKWR